MAGDGVVGPLPIYIGTRTSVQSERGGDEHDGSPACAFCSRIGRTT